MIAMIGSPTGRALYRLFITKSCGAREILCRHQSDQASQGSPGNAQSSLFLLRGEEIRLHERAFRSDRANYTLLIMPFYPSYQIAILG